MNRNEGKNWIYFCRDKSNSNNNNNREKLNKSHHVANFQFTVGETKYLQKKNWINNCKCVNDDSINKQANCLFGMAGVDADVDFNGDFFLLPVIILMLYAFARSSFTLATLKCFKSDLNLFISANRCVFHSSHTHAHPHNKYSHKIFAYWIKFIPPHHGWHESVHCSLCVRIVIYWFHEQQ